MLERPAAAPRRGRPRLLLVTGMMRSGTTLLQSLLGAHPEIRMTREFGMFRDLGSRPLPYLRRTRAKIRRRPAYIDPRRPAWMGPLVAGSFVARYSLLTFVFSRGRRSVSTKTIQRVAGLTFPGVPVVGDKVPAYINGLDRFAADSRLLRVVIYRDGRDVVRSALALSRTGWRNKSFVQGWDAGVVARNWVRAIESMERNADRCHIIRYEALVANPREVLDGLAAYLGVSPAGFDASMIRPTSVGKHREGLTTEELEQVMAVAGPTLERLGYV